MNYYLKIKEPTHTATHMEPLTLDGLLDAMARHMERGIRAGWKVKDVTREAAILEKDGQVQELTYETEVTMADLPDTLVEKACPTWLVGVLKCNPSQPVNIKGKVMPARLWAQECVDCWVSYGRLLDI